MAKAKSKAPKGNPGASNKITSSRINFLHDAAMLLAEMHNADSNANVKSTSSSDLAPSTQSSEVLSRILAKDLRSVAMKSQIRLSPNTKHSICKNCYTVLREGSTCTKELENRSRGGKKPWADVMVNKCTTCGLAKRFPIAVKRQQRKSYRNESIEVTAVEDTSRSV